MSTIRLFTSIESAAASANVSETVIAATWKKTENQESKERAIALPLECLKAPEVPESFRALVEAALLQSAKDTLKSLVDEAPNQYEWDAENFSRPQLTENFLASQTGMKVSKDRLDIMFTASATWKRITSRPEFVRKDQAFMRAVEQFKKAILDLTARNCSHDEEKLDVLVSKLSEEDLNSEFGIYVTRRAQALKKAQKPTMFDLSAL